MRSGGRLGPGSRSSTAAKNRPRDDDHEHHGHHEQHQPRQRHAGTIACVLQHCSTMAVSLRQLRRQSTALLRRAPQTALDADQVQSRAPFSLGFELSFRRPSLGTGWRRRVAPSIPTYRDRVARPERTGAARRDEVARKLGCADYLLGEDQKIATRRWMSARTVRSTRRLGNRSICSETITSRSGDGSAPCWPVCGRTLQRLDSLARQEPYLISRGGKAVGPSDSTRGAAAPA